MTFKLQINCTLRNVKRTQPLRAAFFLERKCQLANKETLNMAALGVRGTQAACSMGLLQVHPIPLSLLWPRVMYRSGNSHDVVTDRMAIKVLTACCF